MPLASLSVLNVHKKAHSTTFTFQLVKIAAPNAVLQVTYYLDTKHGYVPKALPGHSSATVNFPLSAGVNVHKGYAVKVRALNPASNVLVRIG